MARTFHHGSKAPGEVVESASTGWAALQQDYDKPEPRVTAEAPPKPAPRDRTDEILALLRKMQEEIEALKNHKHPAPAAAVSQQKQGEPVKKAPAQLVFLQDDPKPSLPKAAAAEYTLAAGATKLPCLVEPHIVSEVQGYFTAKVSTNVYDTATGRHLLVPQGSTILAQDHSQDLLYGNERIPTTSLSLTLPGGREVDLGKAPVTDQLGIMGLTGDVNNHWWRLFGAVFIGGALRGGMQALQIGLASQAGAGQVAAGISSVGNQAVTQRIGRALDTRPTIEVDAGQLCNVLLTKPGFQEHR